MQFKGKLFNISFVVVYALTRYVPESEADLFDQLPTFTLKKVPKRYLIFIGDDFNAGIGGKVSSAESAIDYFGLGARCSRGSKLLHFAMTNDLVITDTLFKHKSSR